MLEEISCCGEKSPETSHRLEQFPFYKIENLEYYRFGKHKSLILKRLFSAHSGSRLQSPSIHCSLLLLQDAAISFSCLICFTVGGTIPAVPKGSFQLNCTYVMFSKSEIVLLISFQTPVSIAAHFKTLLS